MNTTKKRSWETALGDGNPELNPQGLPQPEFDFKSTGYCSSPAITYTLGLDQDIETASSILGQPGLHAIHQYEDADDIRPGGDGRCAFAALPEPADLLQDVNQHIEIDGGIFDESSSNAVSSSRTFSTPRSVEEQGRPTDPSPATVVCYGQVGYAQPSLLVHCLLYR